MGITARYASATRSSNLKDDAHHHQTEPLAAVALCGETGMNDISHLIWRVKFANDATSFKPLQMKWMEIVKKKSAHRKWPSHISTYSVATKSLNHFLNDICPVCMGKGHLSLFGTPVLSDEPCPACNGQGVKELDCGKDLRDYVSDMVESLEEMQRFAAVQAMRKLACDADF